MNYKVNFKTKTMEWKTKYNKLIDDLDIPNLLKPQLQDTSTITLVGNYKQAAFDVNPEDYNGIYLFTYANCMVLLPCYNLQEDVEYKISACLYNDELGYVTKVLTFRKSQIYIYVYSKENILPAGFTAYLFRIKLY